MEIYPIHVQQSHYFVPQCYNLVTSVSKNSRRFHEVIVGNGMYVCVYNELSLWFRKKLNFVLRSNRLYSNTEAPNTFVLILDESCASGISHEVFLYDYLRRPNGNHNGKGTKYHLLGFLS